MRVSYHRVFKKAIINFDKQNIIKIEDVYNLINDFVDNPTKNSHDNKHIKGCSKFKNLWQIRVNRNYRILYLKFEEEYKFRFIGKHNDAEDVIKNC